MPINMLSGMVRFSTIRSFISSLTRHVPDRFLDALLAPFFLCALLILPAFAQAAPTVTTISHSSGYFLGGTEVTIGGTQFTGTTSVRFGGVAATSVTVVNDTTITATTPAHSTGPVNIVVTAASGTGTGSGLFTYVLTPAPTVLLILPLTGSTTGGTVATITGTGFTGATAVSFGGTPATNVTVVNNTTITATTPPHAAGLVGAAVTGPGGTGTGLGLFTYLQAPPVVLLATPLVGPTTGGTNVTITGLNLTGATAVSFGGTAATGFTVVNDTTVIATTPGHAAGLVNVSVTTPSGSGLGAGLFTYLPAPPTVLLAAPLAGSSAGGTVVTLTGTNFAGATDVTFGGTPSTNFTVVNGTTITATAPAHAAGLVNVAVTTPGGTGSGLGLFTYLPTAQPTVLLAGPLVGSAAGGTSVIITGLNFTGATAVNFGGNPATGVTVVNDTTITATAPAHAAGIVDVSVTSPAGTGLGLGLFTYLPTAQPLVLLAAPLVGPTTGGTSVTITGLNFTGATAVSFGGVAATNVVVVNDATITATAPAHAVGIVDVSVTSAAGSGIGLGLFTYLPINLPIVGLATPLSGPTSGGTVVTISGANFTGTSAVNFGGSPAAFTVVNDTTITATTPAHVAGVVGVSVTSNAGTGINAGIFTYLPTATPTVLLAAPLVGPVTGNTLVTITGLNFTGATDVRFGTVSGTALTVVNDSTITVLTPAHAAGIVDVSVTSAAGTGLGLGLFVYLPTAQPSVLLVTPPTGPITGGTSVTITGLNFTGATAVSFGGTAATGVTVINDTTMTAIAPAHAAGIVNVSVTSPNGTGTDLGLFTYLPTGAPSVLVAAPLTGTIAGGTLVTITGVNFTGATAVHFGGTTATSFTVINDATITATAPAHSAGIVDISVSSPNGTGIGLGLFVYLPTAQPSVLLVAPLTGSVAGGTLVTITGVNFTGATGVNFGVTPATGVTVINDTTITAIAPARAAGIVDVFVTSPNGTGIGLGLFTYLPTAQPLVLAAVPPAGSSAGGTPVTITGLNFTGATSVSFGGVTASNMTVVNDSTITATAPPHAAGLVDVTVSSPAGAGLGLGLFTYLPTAQPLVLLVTPPTGSVAGGTAVTITGANFTAATNVSFGGVLATGVTVINDNTITATAPAHAAGIVNVTVTAPGGTGSGIGLFTYLPTALPTGLLVAPLTGPTTGGTVVTITGLNFTGATGVSFGGVAASGVTVVNDNTVTAIAPSHAAGIVDVTVTSQAGTGIGLGLFTYLPTVQPSVLLVTPLAGSAAGGTSVTLTGLNFTGATGVTFGGVAASAVTVINDTTMTAVTPAHAAGIVDVTVTSQAGTGIGLGLFTFLPTAQPSVVIVNPLNGPTSGGTAVTITGLNFTGATGVLFAGSAATNVQVVNDFTITATTPAHAAAVVDVTVTSPAGSGVGIGLFAYLPTAVPSVLLTTPLIGPTTGATPVTITGFNFTGATSVSFGGTPATGLTVLNDTTITAISPAHAAGIVDVSVTSANGTGVGFGLFTYLPTAQPSVLLVAPLTGSIAGGTPVTVTGLNFTGATGVSFGGTPATGVTVVNDTTITAIAPAHAAGIVDVTVASPNGPGLGVGLFTYLPSAQPSVLLATPPVGPINGGTSVTITGLNLTGATSVSFGGTEATNMVVVNDTTITVTTPPHATGIVPISVTSPTGTGVTLGLFTYLPIAQPSVFLVAPLVGSTAGGTSVTISGVNFSGTTAVNFGATAATGFTVINDTTISAIAPAHAAGLVNVSVTSTIGTGVGLGLFTYLPVAPPSGLLVLPLTGPTTGGTSVNITGLNFTGATSVSFGGTAATGVTVINDTTITAITPAHAAGITDVSITSPAGTGLGLGIYTYVPVSQPVVLLAAPFGGPVTGGTSVTITGLNFTGVTSVGFGGVPATSVTFVNDTTIIATAPAHAVGVVNVSVTSAAGTGLGFGLYTYLPTAQPAIVLVTPPVGPSTGGTSVTITGLNFTGATAVSFGGTPATGVTVLNDTTITATTPAHAAGIVGVSVTSPAGTGFLGSLFTYLPSTGPAIFSLNPTSGSTAGGTVVNISGANLTGATSVLFGSAAAQAFVVVNDTTISAVTPAGSAGVVNVAVTVGVQTATAANAYTYLALPVANNVAVNVPINSVSYAIPLNITGGAPASVAIASGAAQGVALASGTAISYTPNTGYLGSDSFTYTATNASGTSAPATVSIMVVPQVLVLSPPGGALPDGAVGTPYAGATISTPTGVVPISYAVTSGALPAGLSLAPASGAISGTPTVGGLSTFTVTATDSGGVSGSAVYTILVGSPTLPTLTSVAPSWDTTAGGTSVTITGTNLVGVTSVTFGGTAATNVVTVNSTTVTATTPAHAAGVVNVSVTTSGGTVVGASLFTYIAPVRPDPSRDAEVTGLVNAQATSAARFARTQMRNFHGRLERLHNERERAAASMDIRLGMPSNRRQDTDERRDERQQGENANRATNMIEGSPLATYGYGNGNPSAISTLADRNTGVDSQDTTDAEFSRLAFWSGGFVNFGDRDDEGIDIGHTTVGISGGVDYRFSPKFIAGIGIGYGHDRTDIGSNGTESRGQAFSAALYGSYEPIDNFFIDGLLGGGSLNFDSKRYVTASGEFATGDRNGSQIFGSITAAYEIREETWIVSPYGRVEFSRSWLDRYSEQGGGVYGLTYGDQTVDTLSGAVGVRASKSFEMDWGVLTPGFRLEYVHDFEGASNIKLGYSDIGTLPYEIEGRESDRDYLTVGLQPDMQFDNNWNLALDYRATVDSDGDADHTVGAQLRVRF